MTTLIWRTSLLRGMIGGGSLTKVRYATSDWGNPLLESFVEERCCMKCDRDFVLKIGRKKSRQNQNSYSRDKINIYSESVHRDDYNSNINNNGFIEQFQLNTFDTMGCKSTVALPSVMAFLKLANIDYRPFILICRNIRP